MSNSALIVIDIQNDTHKNYKEIIDNINKAIDWAISNNIHVTYIRHKKLSDGTKIFKPNTYGSELAAGSVVTKGVLAYTVVGGVPR